MLYVPVMRIPVNPSIYSGNEHEARGEPSLPESESKLIEYPPAFTAGLVMPEFLNCQKWRCVAHSLQRRLLTKSSISRLECVFVFFIL